MSAPRVGGLVSSAPRVARPAVRAPAMKAGRHDDNKQYNRFLSFLGESEHHVVYSADISERLIVTVQDKRLFVVQCRQSPEPVYLKQGKEEKYYVRVGPSSRALSTSQVVDHVRKRN